MCLWGNTTLLCLTASGKSKLKEIDSCIAELIKTLDAAGIETIASCCGHEKQPGSIVLADGREIKIFSSFNDARKVDKLFPPINA